MPAFRRVEPQQAGPNALGILVPPGVRTLVILRPRALDWDMLPARWEGDPSVPPAFCTWQREEAASVARNVQQALADSVARSVCPVETLGDAAGREHQVWVRAAGWFWIVCRRAQGGAYVPQVFSNRAEAEGVGEIIARFVWPAADAEQEYYFNTQKFM